MDFFGNSLRPDLRIEYGSFWPVSDFLGLVSGLGGVDKQDRSCLL